MPSLEASRAALQRLFLATPVVDLARLFRTLKTKSRMTVFRRLKEVGYLSSYTHVGRFYTLADIPRFDEHGLWFHGGIGFSKVGTLKETVVKLLEDADAGQTPTELEQLLRVRVRNTLVILVHEAKIAREPFERAYLYVSAQSERAAKQISARRKQLPEKRDTAPVLTSAMVVEILVEVIQTGQTRVAPPRVVAKRLNVRGVSVSTEQVQEIFVRYGLKAKKKGD